MSNTDQRERAQKKTDIAHATTNRQSTHKTNQTEHVNDKLDRGRTCNCSHYVIEEVMKTPYPPEDTAAHDGDFPEDQAETVRSRCTLNTYYCCGDCR